MKITVETILKLTLVEVLPLNFLLEDKHTLLRKIKFNKVTDIKEKANTQVVIRNFFSQILINLMMRSESSKLA